MRTYLTVITTDDYAVGAVALWESLRKTRPRHGLVVLITRLVSNECERALQRAGLSTQRVDEHLERANAESSAFAHWNNTFSKLLIFDQAQYEKFVYLDSDMMVLRNLDHLFQMPHMSAMVADRLMPGHESWVQLCSGLMVIEPQAGLAAAIMQYAPAVQKKMTSFSDQDLLHAHFPDWPSHPELQLEQTYGVFPGSLDRYLKRFGYNLNFASPDERTMAVVHFVGSRKPWSWSAPEKAYRLAGHMLRGQFAAVRMLREYLQLIRDARQKLQSSRVPQVS